MLTKEEILVEYAKCLKDPVYPIESYLETFDKTQEGTVPFELFKQQKEVIYNYENNRFNIVTKPRQTGVSTITAAYLATKMAFGDPDNPEKILILANKRETAEDVLSKIKNFLIQFPRWVWGSEFHGTEEKESKNIFARKESQSHIILPNNCECKALATSRDALRGYTPTYLVMDEAAFIEDGAEVYSASMSSLGTGGKAILISTPNGYDPLYHETYENSKKGKNNYKISELKWYRDPRYNQELKWVKDDEVIYEEEFTDESFERMIQAGYKPTSPWYEEMCDLLNHNEMLIAQELDVSFVGSGGNVIEEEYIVYHEQNNVEEPKYQDSENENVWIWEEPIEGHQYLISVDVASGGQDGDYSTFSVIDCTSMKQSAELMDKIRPDELADLVYKYGNLYNAYAIVDIAGGWGSSTVLKLLEYEYDKLHYDEPTTKALANKNELEKYSSDDGKKIPGFNAKSVRTPMISNFEYAIRTGSIEIKSSRLISEMRTFVYKNDGKPEHMKGYTDDAIMALAMGLWVFQNSFKKLETLREKNKAILKGWVSANEGNDKKKKKPDEQSMIAAKTKARGYQTHNPDQGAGRKGPNADPQYMWLFSGMR